MFWSDLGTLKNSEELIEQQESIWKFKISIGGYTVFHCLNVRDV